MTQIAASNGAPPWGIKLAADAQQAIDALPRMFVSNKPFTVATVPSASKWPWRLIILSDGAANKYVAISNGTAWHYMEGTAV